ncbi:MAG: DUF2752 domain-containing protein [bacterium]
MRVFAVGALGLVGIALLSTFDPAGTSLVPPCPFNLATGLYCPGCGSLRAAHHLLSGDLVGALDLNPLAVALVPLLMWHLASRLALAGLGRSVPSALDAGAASKVVLVSVVIFWVLRNLPFMPFRLLAP